MKIYDCFIYFDEELLLDIRLNILNKYVDKFIIVESKFSHRGEPREPNFNINRYKKFQDKIEYILLDKNPKNLFKINGRPLVHYTFRAFQKSKLSLGYVLSDSKKIRNLAKKYSIDTNYIRPKKSFLMLKRKGFQIQSLSDR